jgi:Lar family restriction alleviation protein
MADHENTDGLKPCPFCGSGNVRVHKRDVEPQGDPWYGSKIERVVECTDCSATLFDGYWHDGFSNESDAIAAWNRRAA